MTIPNDIVLAAARAISAADDVSINWDDLSEQSRADYLRMAYAALNAAVPDLRQSVQRVISLHRRNRISGRCTECHVQYPCTTIHALQGDKS